MGEEEGGGEGKEEGGGEGKEEGCGQPVKERFGHLSSSSPAASLQSPIARRLALDVAGPPPPKSYFRLHKAPIIFRPARAVFTPMVE